MQQQTKKFNSKPFGEVCQEWIRYKTKSTSAHLWSNYEMFYTEFFSPLGAMAMNSMNIKKADKILLSVRQYPYEKRAEFARQNCCSLHMFIKITLGEIVDYAIRKKYMENKKELVKFFRVQRDAASGTYHKNRLLYK
ncbi:MAG: hypothetical protein ACLRTQ_09070 [Candidatus Borkfalkia sp.]